MGNMFIILCRWTDSELVKCGDIVNRYKDLGFYEVTKIEYYKPIGDLKYYTLVFNDDKLIMLCRCGKMKQILKF